MAFIPAPNIMMVEARASVGGQNVENRFMLNALHAVAPSDLESAAINVWNWWEIVYAPLLPATVLLREVVATDLTNQNGQQYTYAPDTTTVGTAVGGALPNEVSVCVSLRSSARGRSSRGRFYSLAVPALQMADANNISATYRSALQAAGQTLVTNNLTIAPITIVSYFSNGVARPGGPVYFPVTTALIVDTVVDSMRRRKPGVGT